MPSAYPRLDTAVTDALDTAVQIYVTPCTEKTTKLPWLCSHHPWSRGDMLCFAVQKRLAGIGSLYLNRSVEVALQNDGSL